MFYKTAKSMMVVHIENGRSTSAATRLFTLRSRRPWVRDYAVSPEGRRFLLVEPNSRSEINIVNNWFEELNRLVPTRKK